MKQELCKAFCDGLEVRDVPAGLAVGTAFRGLGGDLIGFYVTRDPRTGFRIEDDGSTVAMLEASGFDLDNQTRANALHEMLAEYGVDYDEQGKELHTPLMGEKDVPRAAMKFVAMLLRVPDLLLLAPERVESTFRADASTRIRSALMGRAKIGENAPIAPRLSEFRADLVLEAAGRPPVAVFFSQSEQRVYEAIVCQLAALYEAKFNLSVIALLERENTISRRLQVRASNRLAAVAGYIGDEDAAVMRIVREVLGSAPEMVH